jgi:hypothetical protein
MGGGGSGETAKDSNDLQLPNLCTKTRRQVEPKAKANQKQKQKQIPHPVSQRR